jgi:uncharacterized protein YjiS (DUF1127 family)
MDPRHRATLIAGLTATPDTRSRGQSCSQTRLLGPDWLTRFWWECARWSERSRQRRALSYLDDRLLNDIGVTRPQAKAEAAKPPWK